MLVLSISSLLGGCLVFTAGQTALAVTFWLFSSSLILLVIGAVLKKVQNKTSIAQIRKQILGV
jgi:hypothetical protein